MTHEFYDELYFNKDTEKVHNFSFTQQDKNSRGFKIFIQEQEQLVDIKEYDLKSCFILQNKRPIEIEAQKENNYFLLTLADDLFKSVGSIEGEIILTKENFELAMNPIDLTIKESIRFKAENQEVETALTIDDIRKIKVNEAKNANTVNGIHIDETSQLTDTKYDEEISQLEESKASKESLRKTNQNIHRVDESIPTKNSELMNDQGFITLGDVPEVDLTHLASKEELALKADIDYVDGKVEQVNNRVSELENERWMLKNEIENGDFSEPLDGNITMVFGTLEINEKGQLVATRPASSDSTPFIAARGTDVTEGDKLYISLDVVKLSGEGIQNRLNVEINSSFKETLLTNYPVGKITITHEVCCSGSFGLRIVMDVSDRVGKIAEAIYDNLNIINLTKTFGAGNEPTKEQMDTLIDKIGWFDDEFVLTQKIASQWQMDLITQNRNAIIELGGTII